MTGSQAETWRKFTFSKAPPWAFWVGGVILRAAMAEYTTGYLPLTKGSVKTLRTVTWTFAALIPLAFLFWVVGILVASVSNSSANGAMLEFLLLLGLGAFFAGVVGLLVGRSAIVPAAKIFNPRPGYPESLIELRNVHPAFVSAVQQLQRARAQSAPDAVPNSVGIEVN